MRLIIDFKSMRERLGIDVMPSLCSTVLKYRSHNEDVQSSD